MTLIPANGIASRRFAAWMDQQNMNTINDLTEMGFIHPKNDREILLHPMIVTTNLTVDELKNPADLARARIYDRVLERCVPILVNDQNVRKLIVAQNISMAQKLLGEEVTA